MYNNHHHIDIDITTALSDATPQFNKIDSNYNNVKCTRIWNTHTRKSWKHTNTLVHKRWKKGSAAWHWHHWVCYISPILITFDAPMLNMHLRVTTWSPIIHRYILSSPSLWFYLKHTLLTLFHFVRTVSSLVSSLFSPTRCSKTTKKYTSARGCSILGFCTICWKVQYNVAIHDKVCTKAKHFYTSNCTSTSCVQCNRMRTNFCGT